MAYTNPRKANARGDIAVDQEDGTVFVLAADVPHTALVHAMALSGEFGAVAEYVAPVPSDAAVAHEVRALRNKILALTDWTIAPDSAASNSDGWREYRQLLRDIPEQAGFPRDVVWPDEPVLAKDAAKSAANLKKPV